eukprot:2564472-Rhodomonas_salina.1
MHSAGWEQRALDQYRPSHATHVGCHTPQSGARNTLPAAHTVQGTRILARISHSSGAYLERVEEGRDNAREAMAVSLEARHTPVSVEARNQRKKTRLFRTAAHAVSGVSRFAQAHARTRVGSDPPGRCSRAHPRRGTAPENTAAESMKKATVVVQFPVQFLYPEGDRTVCSTVCTGKADASI